MSKGVQIDTPNTTFVGIAGIFLRKAGVRRRNHCVDRIILQ
jgi:hypothetical protein